MKEIKKIIWFSRHEPLESQIKELERLFGKVEIIRDPEPFSSAEDVLERYKKMGGYDLVVVAPMSVLGRLCALGVKPLWADMEVVDLKDAEVIAAGRGYRFRKFERVKRLILEFEDDIYRR